MGGNYSRSVYNQLMEVMERLDSVEAEHKKDRKEITSNVINLSRLYQRFPAKNLPCVGMIWGFCQLSWVL